METVGVLYYFGIAMVLVILIKVIVPFLFLGLVGDVRERLNAPRRVKRIKSTRVERIARQYPDWTFNDSTGMWEHS